jgi:hypothetical protein
MDKKKHRKQSIIIRLAKYNENKKNESKNKATKKRKNKAS